ncbi:DUF2312 domain-containing protein [bacterium]|nr:DUF2312 domain-containing protein [bacterium]
MNPTQIPANDPQLISLLERIERVEEDEAALRADKKEIYNEAKSAGYDTKMVRWLIKMRKMDRDEQDELNELQKIYSKAAGL